MKIPPKFWQDQKRNITLEYIFRKHLSHAEVISVKQINNYYEVKLSMKWYSMFTFGYLKVITERQVYDIWYRLYDRPLTVEVVFE